MKNKILVIDDDSFFPKTLESFLPKEKYIVVSASDGEEGFLKTQSENPDLIVLDIMMPKVDGEEFLKKIKSEKKYKSIPIIVASNLSSDKKIADMMSLGVEGYIVKTDESLASVALDIERVLSEKNKD